jgi:hypothetical protein
MKSTRVSKAIRISVLASASLLAAGQVPGAHGAEHLSVPQQGGLPGMPVMTGIERVTNGARVTWDGPPGYYQLYQKLGLNDPKWQAAGKATNLVRHATITTLTSNAFFRVAGPSPRYAGAEACFECHESIHNAVMNTRHAGAFTDPSFVAQGGWADSSCLPCHTVGFGLPTGFVSVTNYLSTNQLAGVQCENCHGPAANHAANPDDLTVRPRVELAGTVCGGCHNAGSHRPHFEEWSASAHVEVTEDMNPADRINRCGRCHSGSSRIALLNGQNPAVAAANDANLGIACVVCHDPHQTNSHPAQLRNPVASTNDYFLSTSDNFTNQYNPNINVCAQCHNHRGASWSSSSRPPHHSLQYNMLLGTVGELPDGTAPWRAAHATQIAKQCVGCHMQTEGGEGQAQRRMSGHSFKVASFTTCVGCHPFPELLVEFTGKIISNQIQQVKASLDRWATLKAPAEIRKYGLLAWEYDNAGGLSNPDGLDTIRGPHSDSDPAVDEQKYVPTNIKKARFNLYLVLHDGSHGAHNALHASELLDAAQSWIWSELYE